LLLPLFFIFIGLVESGANALPNMILAKQSKIFLQTKLCSLQFARNIFKDFDVLFFPSKWTRNIIVCLHFKICYKLCCLVCFNRISSSLNATRVWKTNKKLKTQS
jgi:hypothetical protein